MRERYQRFHRSIFWATLFFVVFQGVLAYAVSAKWIQVYDLIYADKRKLFQPMASYFQAAKADSKPLAILALGSSRTLSGLNMKPFLSDISQILSRPTEGFNFAVPAAGSITHNLYLRRLLKEGLRPDFVLIEVLPPFLAGQVPQAMESSWLKKDRIYREEYALLARFGFNPNPEPTAFSFDWMNDAIYEHRFALMAQMLPSWLRSDRLFMTSRISDSHGWVEAMFTSRGPDQYDKGLQLAWQQYHKALENFQIGGPTVEALKDLLQFCQQEGMPAAVVLMPEAEDFRAWYTEDARQQIDQFLQQITSQHGLPLIDAREWIPRSGFADGHHLLLEGSTQFSHQLAEVVAGILDKQLTQDCPSLPPEEE